VGTGGLHDILTSADSPWCTKGNDKDPESCNAILQKTLTTALIDIRKLSREQSMQDWRWDQLQRSAYAHRPFSDVQPLNLLFEYKVPTGGSPNSVNVAASRYHDKKGFSQGLGSSSRQVISMGKDRVVHEYMNCTGQSGNVISAHYGDMVEPFNKVEFYHFPGSAGASK
jgi:penicillin amidase